MGSTHKVILAETFSPTFVGLTFRVGIRRQTSREMNKPHQYSVLSLFENIII